MKESYHSIVVPMVEAMTALRSSAWWDAECGSAVDAVMVPSPTFPTHLLALTSITNCHPGQAAEGRASRDPGTPAFIVYRRRWATWIPVLAALGRDDNNGVAGAIW